MKTKVRNSLEFALFVVIIMLSAGHNVSAKATRTSGYVNISSQASTIALGNTPAGIYILRATTSNGVVYQKMQIK